MDFAVLLYDNNQGMAKALTPLSMSVVSDEALKTGKILLLCSKGNGHNEKYVAIRAVKVNPENTCAVVRDPGEENAVVKYLTKASSRFSIERYVFNYMENTLKTLVHLLQHPSSS